MPCPSHPGQPEFVLDVKRQSPGHVYIRRRFCGRHRLASVGELGDVPPGTMHGLAVLIGQDDGLGIRREPAHVHRPARGVDQHEPHGILAQVEHPDNPVCPHAVVSL